MSEGGLVSGAQLVRQGDVPPREHIAAANESEVVKVPASHLQYAF
jgi:hypothetical protein